ncbi:alpha-glycosidase [Shivajiella indica]|uniref:Alpha-glycosidase n=1 Tax=Shivajiella indica TaxID=872115 RepID=A0ABW5BAF2_9BACT
MKSICLVLHTHQPISLKNYRFYDIGNSSAYFNEATNRELIQNLVTMKFNPVNQVLMKIFQENQYPFKISFSFSGTTLDLLEHAASEMVRDLKKMNELGYVEFLSETYSHSILSKKYLDEFKEQIKIQKQKVWNIFGQLPQAFLNISGYPTQFFSSILPELGLKVMIKFNKVLSSSSKYHYQILNSIPIKVLFAEQRPFKNFTFPLNRDKKQQAIDIDLFLSWVKNLPDEDDVVCLVLEYANLIPENPKDLHVLDFIKKLPRKAKEMGIGFSTPSEMMLKNDSFSFFNPGLEENLSQNMDTNILNVFQNEIFGLLNDLKEKVYQTQDQNILKTWYYLQDQGLFDELYADNNVESEKNNAIQFYITFRNVIEDFTQRVEQILINENSRWSNIDKNPI